MDYDTFTLVKKITNIDHETWSYRDDIALHIIEKLHDRFPESVSLDDDVIAIFKKILGRQLTGNNPFPQERHIDSSRDDVNTMIPLFTNFFVGDDVDLVLDNIDYFDNHMTVMTDSGFFRFENDIVEIIKHIVDKAIYECRDNDDITIISRTICHALETDDSVANLRGNYLFKFTNISTMECISTPDDMAKFRKMIKFIIEYNIVFLTDLNEPLMMIRTSFYNDHCKQLDNAYSNGLELYVPEKLPECYRSNFTNAMLYAFRHNDRLYVLPIKSIKDVNRFKLLCGTTNNSEVLTCVNYDFVESAVDFQDMAYM